MPLAMFVAGGFASTGGLVPITRGGSLTLLRNLAAPTATTFTPLQSTRCCGRRRARATLAPARSDRCRERKPP